MKKFFCLFLALAGSVFAQNPHQARMISGINLQVGTSYPVTCADVTYFLIFNNAAPVAVAMLAPTNSCVGTGTVFQMKNLGAGTVTLSAAGVTFDGNATLSLATGQGVDLYNDGATKYYTQPGIGTVGGNSPAGASGDLQCKSGTVFGSCGLNLSGSTISGSRSLTLTGNFSLTGNILLTGNLQINGGTALTSVSGNSGRIAQSSGSLTNAHFVAIDASGNFVDGGAGTAGIADPGANGFLSRTALNTVAARTFQPTSGGNFTWTNPDGVTGNPTPSFVFPSKVLVQGGLCNNATSAPAWNLPTASAAAANCNTGTNVQEATLDFADGQSAQYGYLLPSDWTGAIDAKLIFFNVSTSGTVIWNIQTSCSATNGSATDDNAFNAADAFGTITLNTPTNAQWAATKTGINITGCSAGNTIKFKLSRATDTAVGAARMKSLELTIRRQL